ncbi:MAG: prepilin-type N-terminal cleavage/methylation domain-containing protein [Azoarcus sp.]|jgi:prepilin-type N-terminal cleavage/methylation domain-containing protein|nr:prepilin-type N-terminal cleavage/methylation domain-containing protein [Azoarcus sp.]
MPLRFVARRAGFTLVELLVVVAILSAVAVAAFGLLGENRAQVRIEDTHNRLTLLRRAILGVEAPAYGGQMRLSGFVADNGRLPTSIRELVSLAGHVEQGAVVPEHSSTVGDDCKQTGTSTKLEKNPLIKGHRGNYLASVAHGGAFRDGWGNMGQGGDTENFGWIVADGTDPTIAMTITSLGADNAESPPLDAGIADALALAEADQTLEISEADWRVDPVDLRVKLRNMVAVSDSDGNPDPADFSKLGAALLVFENTGGGGQWRQLNTAGSSCVDDMAQEAECELHFASATCAIPLGRHLLVLTNDGKPLSVTDDGKTAITFTVDFYPGVTPPEIVRDIHHLTTTVAPTTPDAGTGGGSETGDEETP